MTIVKSHVRKGDTVIVLSGKDKDKKGKVLRVLPAEGKVLVEGVNVAKRHTKPTRAVPQGGVIEKAIPVPLAKVMVICPKCSRPTRTQRRVAEDGAHIRVCKECGGEIDK